MTKLKCVLVFFIIFTGSLFSQDEGNEIIEEDTITLANTVVVTEVDAVVVEESVSEPEEKIDLSYYDFYNDYLDYVKKTNSIDDTILVNVCKSTGIISGRIGVFLIGIAYSVALDIPIDCNNNITAKYITCIGGIDGPHRFSFLGVGLGHVATKTKYFILKLYVCPGLALDDKRGPGMSAGADILFKIFEPCYISINPNFLAIPSGLAGMVSLGLNLVY